MTALPNTKSTVSSAIDTVTKPYANATATTQETVSQVSSSNLSSIDNNGKLLVSSCSRGFRNKHLPSLFPLVVSRQMHGKQRTGANEYCVTTGRLGLGFVGLEGDALGLSALLARNRDNQLFLGLRQ